MTDEIRRKHEAWKQRWPTESEHVFAILTIADVDALFAALGEASGIVDRFKAFVDERDRIYGGMMARDQLQVVFKQILKGGGDERCK